MQGEQVRDLPSHYHSSILTPVLRYIIRDFHYSADQIEKEQEEMQVANTAEKELWVRFPPTVHSLTNL